MPIREIKALKIGEENLRVAPHAVNFFETEEEDFYEQFEEGTLKDGFHTLNVLGLKQEVIDGSEEAFAITSNATYIISAHLTVEGTKIKFRNISTNEVTIKLLNNFKNKSGVGVNQIGLHFKWNTNQTLLYVLYTFGSNTFESNPRRDVLYSFNLTSLSNEFVTVQTFTNQSNTSFSYGPSIPAKIIEGANDTYIIGSYNNGLNNASSFYFVYSLKTNNFYYNVTGASAGQGGRLKEAIGEETRKVNFLTNGLEITKIISNTIDNITYDFIQVYHETLIVKPDNTNIKLPNSIYTGLGKKFITIPSSDQAGTDSVFFASTHTYIIKELNFTTGLYDENLNQNMTLNGSIRQFVPNALSNATFLISYRYSGGGPQFNYYSIKLENGSITVVNTLLAPSLKFASAGFYHTYFGRFFTQNNSVYKLEDNLTATLAYDFVPTQNAQSILIAKSTTKNNLNYFIFYSYANSTAQNVQVLFQNGNNLSLLYNKPVSSGSVITDSAGNEFIERSFAKKESLGFTTGTYNFIGLDTNIICYDNFERVDDLEFLTFVIPKKQLGTTFTSKHYSGNRQNLIKQNERIFFVNEDYNIIELKNQSIIVKVKGQLIKNNLIISQTL